MRRRSGLLAEKARKVRRVGKTKLFGNVVDSLSGEDEPALGVDKNALANEMAAVTPVARLTWSLSRSAVLLSFSA